MKILKSPLQLIKRKAFAAILCQVGSAILTFTFIWSVAKILPANEAGVFLYTYTVMMVLVQLSRAGTENSMIRWLSVESDVKSLFAVTLKTFLYIAFTSALLTALFLAIAKSGVLEVYKSKSAYNTLICMSGVTIIFATCQVLGSYFQSKSEIYSQYWCLAIGVSVTGCLTSVTSSLLQPDLDSYGLSLYFLYGNIVFLIICTSLFLLSLKRTKNSDQEKKQKESYDKSFFGLIIYTAPFAFLSFLNISIQWGGQLISGAWLSESELAVLSVAIRLSTLISFVYVAFNSILAPRISRQYDSEETSSIHDSSIPLVAASSLYALILVAIFVIFGRPLLGLFGDIYVAGYIPLLILSFSWLVRVILGPAGTILLMTGNVRISKRNLCYSAVISIILAGTLTPLLGINGASLSTALGGMFLYTLNYISVKRIFGIDYLSPSSIRMQKKSIIAAIRQFST